MLAKIKKTIFILMFTISTIGLVLTCTGLINIFLEYKKADTEYDLIRNNYTNKISSKMAESSYKKLTVDFPSLKNLNSDIIGYIDFEKNNISYPIVLSDDNNYYLNRTFEKNFNISGSIFMDCVNKKNFMDSNTILYGHNMKNGTMFAELNNFSKLDYFIENQYFWIYTPTHTLKYQIYSTYLTDPNDIGYTTEFSSLSEFKSFIDSTITSSSHRSKINISEKDKIITLSTCTKKDDIRRIVHAVLIEKHKM